MIICFSFDTPDLYIKIRNQGYDRSISSVIQVQEASVNMLNFASSLKGAKKATKGSCRRRHDPLSPLKRITLKYRNNEIDYYMQTIKLNNGVEMPMLGFGVFQVDDLAVCEKAVSEAIETGYRLLDTAMTYNNEEAVGRAVRNSGIKREDFFLTTKAWITDMGYDRTMKAFDKSMKKLGLDYLDLYLIHQPFGDYYGAWRAMEQLYKEGRIRAIGVSNFSSARLIDMSYNFEILPIVNQIELHPHYQREEELKVMHELHIQPEAWAPFAEGLKGTFTDPLLVDIAQKHNKTSAQVMLRWNLQRGVAVIPKSVHKERMAENFNVWDFSLDEDDMRRIATLDKGKPSMLDPEKPDEVKRLYEYLNNPVLTSLK